MAYFDHDFKKYPELSNSQLETLRFSSPHAQLTEDFHARVVKVHDGDTITVMCDVRDFPFPLRLLDVDAPELNEGGEEAREWLRSKLEGEEVQVVMDSSRRVGKYGRLLGRVLHGGLDVGEEMVHLGLVSKFGAKGEGELPSLGHYFKAEVSV